MVVALVVALTLVALTVLVARTTIALPLGRLADTVGYLAGGDLTRRPAYAFRDEMGRAFHAMGEAIDHLRELVSTIRTQADAGCWSAASSCQAVTSTR